MGAKEPEQVDAALRAANLALGGRGKRGTRALTSIELRLTDAREGPWELAALVSVVVLALLVVLGVWFY